MGVIKIMKFCVIISLNVYLAQAFIDNEKSGGHNLFHGLEVEPRKSMIMGKSTTYNNQKTSHIHGEHKDEFIEKLDMVHVSPNRNNLLNDFDNGIKKSSIYLQPEPRGLQYMLNTGDFNPFLIQYMRKRSVGNEFRGEPHDQSKKRCDGKHVFCALRLKRQIPIQPGNVIPGSRGQSVLFGVPYGAPPGNIYPTQPSHIKNTDFNGFRGPFQSDYNQGRHVGGYQTFGY